MAKFGVEGRWGAEITLAGNSLALTPQTLSYLCVSSGVTKPMPTCTFTVLDQGADLITNVGVKDGMPLQVTLEDGNGGPPFHGDFVVVGGPTKACYTPKGVTFTVNAFLNKMGYLRKVTNITEKATSSEMIKKLASEAGITSFDMDSTNDAMAWLPTGLPIAKRALDIAEHGWAGASSAMVLTLNENGMLRYKDLATLATAAPVAQFGGVVKNPFIRGPWVPVVQFLADSKQGLYNNAGGWGATGVVPGLSGLTGIGMGDALQVEDDIGELLSGLSAIASNLSTIMSGAGGLNISSDLSKLIGEQGSKRVHAPLSSGNTHKRYQQAVLQNMRGKAAFGNDIYLLSTAASGLSNLDPVYYHCTHPMTLADMPIFSGDYVITDKQMMLMQAPNPKGGKGQFGYYEVTCVSNNAGG